VSEDPRRDDIFDEEDHFGEDISFDELARGLVNGRLSRRRALKLFIAAALSSLVPARFAAATPDKVTICHKPGTPAEKTMYLPESAIPGHLGHGDTLGVCGETITPTTTSTTSSTSSTTSTTTTTEGSTTTSTTTTTRAPTTTSTAGGCRTKGQGCTSRNECCRGLKCRRNPDPSGSPKICVERD
jgi:hypothetical protein